MKNVSLFLIGSILLSGCQGHGVASGSRSESVQSRSSEREFRQVRVTQEQPSPGVDITDYVLVTDDADAVGADSAAIMRLKAAWPLAMQTKDEELFDRILAADFTFRAQDEFWTRAAYIRDRVNPERETVHSARYENLVLQFFGGVALLTYCNVVDVTSVDGSPSTLRMSWADVYVKEAGEWKIGGSHLIDVRQEERAQTSH
jgi:ketosteroid isomerase-like protein